MNLMNLMPRFGKDSEAKDEAQLDKEDAEWAEFVKATRPKNGPQKRSFYTNGQLRRQRARDAKSQQRKANVRYRRRWMATEERFSRLKGQIAVVTYRTPATPAMQQNVARALEAEHGSIAQAIEFYNTVAAERTKNAA